ncbi:MAG TPA: cobalamin-binding protein [Coriobacteriia bacterium]|nr:cobalamin-binding protein [Coriobacteriia bacterium]
MSVFEDIALLVQQGKAKDVAAACQKALDEGATAQKVLDDGLLAGMAVVGEKFKNNEVFVPEVMISAKALNIGVELLKPLLASEGAEPLGKAIIFTVEGDLHDIGKNLVKLMMEGVGFEVTDLGADIKAEEAVQAVKDSGATIVAMSAMLTTTMAQMGKVVEAFEAAGMRDQVKFMVGGTPITDKYCKDIGADSYSVDAASAAEAAKGLVA